MKSSLTFLNRAVLVWVAVACGITGLIGSIVTGPTSAFAQSNAPVLRTAELAVDIQEQGTSLVDVVYDLTKPVDTTRTVPLRGLLVFETSIEFLRAEVNGRVVSINLTRTRPLLIEASLPIPRQERSQETVNVRLRYRVSTPSVVRPDRFDVTVPLIFVNLAPDGASDSTFSAVIRTPAAYDVTERFPVIRPKVSIEDGQKQQTFTLQVVPAYVRLKGTIGEGGPWLTFARTVDIVVISSLLFIGLLFWFRTRISEPDTFSA